MRAVDTNLVVRYLVPADDRVQAARAAQIMEDGNVFVPSTVLLETEWVLRTYYRFSQKEIAEALCGLAGLEGVQVEHPHRLRQALEWLLAGLDFADAFHLASADGSEVFLTFDKVFAKRSRGLSRLPVRQP